VSVVCRCLIEYQVLIDGYSINVDTNYSIVYLNLFIFVTFSGAGEHSIKRKDAYKALCKKACDQVSFKILRYISKFIDNSFNSV